MPAAPPDHRHGPLLSPGSPITPEHHQLVSPEQIRQTLRLEVVQLDAVRLQGQVREHRGRDLGGERAHCLLDVAARLDVLGHAPGALGQAVEQVRIDVIPDPERKDAERPAATLGLIGDALGVGLAHGCHPVRQEHDHAQPTLGGRFGECLCQGARDVGTAVGVEAADPFLRDAHVISRHVRPTGRVATHAAAERDHPEPVTRAERAEQLHQRSLGLVELVARHRARHVEHGDQIAAYRRCLGAAGREEKHEEPVFPQRLAGDERHPHQVAGERQEQLEIPSRGRIGERELDAVVAAVCAQSMRR